MTTGYAKIRRGLIEHLHDGNIAGMEYFLYLHLIIKADFKSGVVWKTSAPYLSQELELHSNIIKRNLGRLEAKGYIKRFMKAGLKHYSILIDKYELSEGIRTVAAETTDLAQIVAEKVQIDEGQTPGNPVVTPPQATKREAVRVNTMIKKELRDDPKPDQVRVQVRDEVRHQVREQVRDEVPNIKNKEVKNKEITTTTTHPTPGPDDVPPPDEAERENVAATFLLKKLKINNENVIQLLDSYGIEYIEEKIKFTQNKIKASQVEHPKAFFISALQNDWKDEKEIDKQRTAAKKVLAAEKSKRIALMIADRLKAGNTIRQEEFDCLPKDVQEMLMFDEDHYEKNSEWIYFHPEYHKGGKNGD